VIDIRAMCKDGEETKVLKNIWNAVYNYRREVLRENPNGEERPEMTNRSFEKGREMLK
jgi:hypothetical protein